MVSDVEVCEFLMQNEYDDVMSKLSWREVPGYIAVAENDIQTLERDIGYELPPDYRTFLLKYGMTASQEYLTFPNPDNPKVDGGGVDAFFGLNPADSRDLRRQKSRLKRRLPKNVLPIAESPGGLICLCLDGTHFARVYWWDRAEDSLRPWKNLFQIARDFDTFIRSVYVR